MANVKFAKKLKSARLKAGLTQKDVYIKLNVPQSTFSSWETAKSEPNADTLIELCRLYNIQSFSYFENTTRINKNLNENTKLTTEELEHIEKYRTLDEVDKKIINNYVKLNKTNRELFKTFLRSLLNENPSDIKFLSLNNNNLNIKDQPSNNISKNITDKPTKDLQGPENNKGNSISAPRVKVFTDITEKYNEKNGSLENLPKSKYDEDISYMYVVGRSRKVKKDDNSKLIAIPTEQLKELDSEIESGKYDHLFEGDDSPI